MENCCRSLYLSLGQSLSQRRSLDALEYLFSQFSLSRFSRLSLSRGVSLSGKVSYFRGVPLSLEVSLSLEVFLSRGVSIRVSPSLGVSPRVSLSRVASLSQFSHLSVSPIRSFRASKPRWVDLYVPISRVSRVISCSRGGLGPERG